MRAILLALAVLATALLSACAMTPETELAVGDAAARALIEDQYPQAAGYLKELPGSGASYDGGGLMLQYQLRVAHLLASDIPFTVPSVCKSACTLYLGLADDPETCFRRDGAMWFHPPVPLTGNSEDAAYALMAAHIAAADPRLALEVLLRLELLEPGEWVVLNNSDLIAAGYLRACADPVP